MKRRIISFFPTNEEGDVVLPLTPMADVLIVVVIFLLKGLSMNTDMLGLRSDIHLPEASGAASNNTSLRVGISGHDIDVGNKKIVTWSNYSQGNQIDNLRLEQALVQAGFVDSIRPSLSNLEIHADRLAPYAVVRSVLSLASEAGAANVKLGVIGK
jgi:biopolymer transport protein ExbD